MRKIVIIGATSAIAQATARFFAKDNSSFFLVGRYSEKLQIVADDLKARGAAKVGFFAGDFIDSHHHASILAQASEFLSGYDTVLIAHASLSNQEACERSYEETERELQINCLSILSFLTLIANDFEKTAKNDVQMRGNGKGGGTIAVIGSVAGDRGRKSNYVYGTAKAALATFLQGLRGRLAGVHGHVLTIKPGFVDTPMVAHLKTKHGAMFASCEKVGYGIYQAILKRKEVVYLPGYWRWMMGIVNVIPEGVFKNLNF